MFRFIKDKLQKIYSSVTTKLGSLFSKREIDDATLLELQRILIEADAGVTTTRFLIDGLQKRLVKGQLKTGSELQDALKSELKKLLNVHSYDPVGSVYMLVGVNGTGKTTFISKLAHLFATQGKKVLVAGADTFRAAATDQLKIWAERSGVDYIGGAASADPASVVFAAGERFSKGNYDILIIDTAGRLQNKINLMRELEKMHKVVQKTISNASVITLLTIDAMLGQNSFDQARLFNEATRLNGIVLTKMDGTGKGGIVFAIAHELKIPIAYVSYGEKMTDMVRFNPDEYVDQLLEG